MRITGIKAWQIDLPLKEGRYSWSNGNFVEVFDTTIVAVETDAGITGHAECCPLGSAYLPAYALGVRSGLAEIGPKLIGRDPTDLNGLNRHMDAVLRGHAYVKAPIDIACWDILGKLTGLPLHTLLGGAAQDRITLYRAISQQSPEEMAAKIAGYRAEGYTRFQLKVGGDADDDIARIRACRDDPRALATSSSPTPTPAGPAPRPPASSPPSPTSTSTSSSPARPMPNASRSAAAPAAPSCSTRWWTTPPCWSAASPTTRWT